MVYLIHFDEKLSHAGHYIGYSRDPISRFNRHAAGHGARIIKVLIERGIGFEVVKIWNEGDRKLERLLKKKKNAPKLLCPKCREGR